MTVMVVIEARPQIITSAPEATRYAHPGHFGAEQSRNMTLTTPHRTAQADAGRGCWRGSGKHDNRDLEGPAM